MADSNKPTSAAAIVGLVLGILAIVTSWIPIVNNLSFMIGAIGLVFSIVGVRWHRARHQGWQGPRDRGARRERALARDRARPAERLERGPVVAGRRPLRKLWRMRERSGAAGDLSLHSTR